jgi:lipopolysaccharide/colanic/teichoic acid biosynthesis glycosyltransferase/glycosyltransferase involved in cell wall biosynthesis
MSRLRVLHFGKYYPPSRGGIETVVETLCRGERESADSHALVINRKGPTRSEVVDGVPVVRVGSVATIGAVSVAPMLPVWLARARADVMVLHEPNPMALVAYAMARPRIPLVVWFHSEVIRPLWKYRLFYQPFLDFALRRASRIVVASPPMKDVPALAAHRDKCVVVPFGLTFDRYVMTPTAAASMDSIRRAAARPILLFVGRFVDYKGVDVLLRAMRGIDADLMLVGDGPRRQALQDLAFELGIADRVHFLGEVGEDSLLAWYHACDALVLPSVTRQEAFGMVQLEAMLCGHPVVSTDLGTGVAWVNQHERTGLVVPPGDADALHRAIARLLSDAELRKQLGRTARARVHEEFSDTRMCAETLAVYREAIAAAGLARRGGSSHPPVRCRTRASLIAKRALDVVLSGAGLVASAPLWGLIALLIKLEDGGPVFYGQERSGLNGVPFEVKKFRSMIPNAEASVGAMQATEHDPRVTRIGRLLRATAMDELPQLWNIFRGDMSFTGPRALRPGEIEAGGSGALERLEDVPGFNERASVRPGLTGIAQIYAPRDITRRWKFKYDILYVRRQSFWLDVRLILLSFWITFRGSWEARGEKF